MNASKHQFPSGRRLSGVISLCALWIGSAVSAWSQIPYASQAGDMMLFESAGATRVVEKVRSAAPGIVMEVFVKPGDTVRKGQVLGHTELDATKLQLDLAEHAMRSKANVNAARGQAEAWTVTREETEAAVRRRSAERSRLDWAMAMEKMYHSNYEVQMDAEDAQRIQYEYWKSQYEKRFFRSPVDGVVSEVLVEPGKSVNYATHAFTVSNESTFSIPVTVPAEMAQAALEKATLPVRTADGKSVSKGLVDSVIDDPRETGRKIIRLLVKAVDFPAAVRPKLSGMKFDVLLPELAASTRDR